jgi:colicin import membrane protein
MLESLTRGQNRGIFFSAIAHATLVIFLLLRSVFIPTDSIDYESAIRVDIVALPDKNPAPPSPAIEEAPKPAAEVKPAPPPPEPVKPQTDVLPDKKPVVDEKAINLNEKKNQDDLAKKKLEEKKKQEALDRIKKMSALESIKSSVETERIEKIVGQSEPKPKSEFKGNVLNAGTELTGINKIQHENYIALIDRQIKDNWTLPQWLANKDFKAQALLKIDQNGVIIYNQIYKSSGNTSYDETVTDTIQRSGPFPKPPEKFSAILSEKGVLIGFPE